MGTMEIKPPSIDAALDVQDHQNFDPRPALSHAASSFWSTLSSSGKAASVSVSAAIVVSMNSTTSARNSHTMEPSVSVWNLRLKDSSRAGSDEFGSISVSWKFEPTLQRLIVRLSSDSFVCQIPLSLLQLSDTLCKYRCAER